MVLATVNSGAYKFFLLLHILSIIVGFGGVVWNGLYGVAAKARLGPGGQAVAEANLRVTTFAEYVIYSVPIWGFALIGLSDDAIKFSQTWIWLSLVLYLVGVGVAHAVLIKNHKRMLVLMGELSAAGPPPAGATGGPPPQVAELDQLSQQQAMFGMALNVLLVIIIALMIWKPGL